jgi:inosose dehydratase
LPLVEHMHLKDFVGGKPWGGYCPLGMGKVDIPGILDMLEAAGTKLDVMIEQDPSADQPISPTQSAEISKVYLQKVGYTFRS